MAIVFVGFIFYGSFSFVLCFFFFLSDFESCFFTLKIDQPKERYAFTCKQITLNKKINKSWVLCQIKFMVFVYTIFCFILVWPLMSLFYFYFDCMYMLEKKIYISNDLLGFYFMSYFSLNIKPYQRKTEQQIKRDLSSFVKYLNACKWKRDRFLTQLICLVCD